MNIKQRKTYVLLTNTDHHLNLPLSPLHVAFPLPHLNASSCQDV